MNIKLAMKLIPLNMHLMFYSACSSNKTIKGPYLSVIRAGASSAKVLERPSSEKMCSKSRLQEGGGSVFILLWAVSGHHYLTLQKERCKQMLAAHSAAKVRLAEACERGWRREKERWQPALLRMLRSEA